MITQISRAMRSPCAWLVLLLLWVMLVYSNGLPGDFEFDDGVNLFNSSQFIFKERDLDNLIRATFSSDSGPLRRPVSMFTFAVNQYLTDFDPYYFKATNIAIHAMNVAAVFWLCSLLLRALGSDVSGFQRRWLPLLAAAMWGLHPLNLTGVLYIVQRMTSLSAGFMILALGCYVSGRLRMVAGLPGGYWLGVGATGLFALLAVFSKESALLLPLLVLLVECVFLKFAGRAGKPDPRLRLAIIAVGLLPVLVIIGYTVLKPSWITSGYAIRSFTMEERLLTEARIFWFYLGEIFLPNIQNMGLYHDDLVVSRGFFSPLSTAFAVLGFGSLLAAAYFCRRALPLFAFGVAWFVTGHLLESTVWPLELVYEHRNYLPMFGVVFAFCYYLTRIEGSPGQVVRKLAVPAMVLALSLATGARAMQWQNLTDHAISEALNHPGSTRANFQLARVYAKWFDADRQDNYYRAAKEHFEKSIRVDLEERNGGYFGLIHLSYQANQPLDPWVVPELVSRLPTSSAIGTDLAFFGHLANCQINLDCKLPDKDFFAIGDAFLRNPRLSGGFQASVNSTLGVYSASKTQDWGRAEQYFLKAVAQSDTAMRWLDLAEYYRAMGLLPKARETMERARKSSDAERYAVEIRRSEDHLRQFEREVVSEKTAVRKGE